MKVSFILASYLDLSVQKVNLGDCGTDAKCKSVNNILLECCPSIAGVAPFLLPSGVGIAGP